MTSKNTIDILITATDKASTVIKQTQTTLTNLWEKSNFLWKIREENKWKISIRKQDNNHPVFFK